MRKRILTIALAGLMVLSLASCKKINDAQENAVEVTDYSQYVTLGDYTGFSLDITKADVTDDRLQEKIDSIISDQTTKEEITEGTVKDGDSINLDYAGTLDGEAVDGASATDYDYTIGGGFISDLNDQLIGLEVGKETELTCTFPDDYSTNTDLAGKTVVFTVTVNCIYGEDVVPEWNDDFINTYTEGEYTTTSDYEKYLKEELKTSNLDTQQQSYESAIWSSILDNSTIKDYPEDKLTETYNECYDYYKSQYENMASYYGYTYDELLTAYGTTDEELQTQCMETAKSSLGYIMLACVIADKEGITVSADEYESMAESQLADSDYTSVDEFESEYGEGYFMESFIFQAVTDWLRDQNTMVEVDETTAATEETTAATEETTATTETTTAE